jgi:hypothetical protein
VPMLRRSAPNFELPSSWRPGVVEGFVGDVPHTMTVLRGIAGGRSEPILACVQAMRTDFGRPSSSMRFRTATTTFTSMV